MKIKLFQNNRLKITYQDLLEKKDTQAACRFFLDYLYTPRDLRERDQQVERVLPKAEKYLPQAAIQVLTKVIYMDYLAEDMDLKMSINMNKLKINSGISLEEQVYVALFRETGEQAVRRQQVLLIPDVGRSLIKLTRVPLLASVLRMTRGAARKAGLEDFHDFLRAGLSAFASLKRPEDFFQTIVDRELALMDAIFNGEFQGFQPQHTAG